MLIAEIQQNSNCTYRVYDYGRTDKDGKPRELHIDKAVDVAVTEPPKYGIKPLGKEENHGSYVSQKLTECDLFSVDRYKINETVTLFADENSFHHLLVIDGSGTIDNRCANKGGSFLVPAAYGEYKISGNIEVLLTKI